MLFYDRPDGKKIKQPHAMNALMPYMMRGRNESAVYYEKDIDMENALRYIRQKNSALAPSSQSLKAEYRYSLFGLVLAAAVRTVALRPELNRFIHTRGLYQRNHIAISFIVKQKMTEEAPEANAKVFFEPADTLDSVTEKINAAIRHAREYGEGGDGEKIAKIAHSIPGGKALIMALYRFLDRFNIAPLALIKTDPLYSTAYFANLGSIGLDTPYHHLYEWGNASIFVVLGKLFQKETRQGSSYAHHHYINFKVTLDERISDGLYFARSAALFARFFSHPELLELPLDELRELLKKKQEA